MQHLPDEIQFCLDTFEPEALQNLMFLGGTGEDITYFIPCKDTMQHWLINNYNFAMLRGLPLIDDPMDPLPQGRLQIAIYRSIVNLTPIAVGSNFAQMVPGTYFDSGVLPPVPIAFAPISFADVFSLGGMFWIVIRFSDVTLAGGINTYQFAYQGWTVSDANLTHTLLQDAVGTGALPQTYAYTNVVPVINYPWIRSDYV